MSEPALKDVEQISYYLRNIHRRLDRDIAFLLSQEGLTFAQMIVLRHIRGQGETTLAGLTDSLQWAASTLSGIVKRLERDELIERLPDPQDLRVYRLRITDRADHILEKTCLAYYHHLAKVLSHFSPIELSGLMDSLQGLWQAVQNEQPRREG